MMFIVILLVIVLLILFFGGRDKRGLNSHRVSESITQVKHYDETAVKELLVEIEKYYEKQDEIPWLQSDEAIKIWSQENKIALNSYVTDKLAEDFAKHPISEMASYQYKWLKTDPLAMTRENQKIAMRFAMEKITNDVRIRIDDKLRQLAFDEYSNHSSYNYTSEFDDALAWELKKYKESLPNRQYISERYSDVMEASFRYLSEREGMIFDDEATNPRAIDRFMEQYGYRYDFEESKDIIDSLIELSIMEENPYSSYLSLDAKYDNEDIELFMLGKRGELARARKIPQAVFQKMEEMKEDLY